MTFTLTHPLARVAYAFAVATTWIHVGFYRLQRYNLQLAIETGLHVELARSINLKLETLLLLQPFPNLSCCNLHVIKTRPKTAMATAAKQSIPFQLADYPTSAHRLPCLVPSRAVQYYLHMMSGI